MDCKVNKAPFTLGGAFEGQTGQGLEEIVPRILHSSV